MKVIKAVAFCVLASIQATAFADTTYDFGEFKYRGIEIGMTVGEVLEFLSSTHSLGPDDLTFARDKKPLPETGETNLIWRISHRADDFSINLDMFVDLDLRDSGDYMVVKSFRYRDFEPSELYEVVAIAEEEYGPYSLKRNSGNVARSFSWCTKIKISPSGKKEECDGDFPFIKISIAGFEFRTQFYNDKYFKTDVELRRALSQSVRDKRKAQEELKNDQG